MHTGFSFLPFMASACFKLNVCRIVNIGNSHVVAEWRLGFTRFVTFRKSVVKSCESRHGLNFSLKLSLSCPKKSWEEVLPLLHNSTYIRYRPQLYQCYYIQSKSNIYLIQLPHVNPTKASSSLYLLKISEMIHRSGITL